MKKYAAEGLGTFFLVLALGLTSDPIAIALVLIALLYVCIHISDAHLNPGISLAAWVRGKITMSELFGYTGSQFGGAVAGAGLCWLIAGTTYYSAPDAQTGTFQFIAVEMLFSLLFYTVFLCMIYPSTRRRSPVFGLIAGIAFGGCLMISEPIAGFGLNPASASAFALFDLLNHGSAYQYLPVYILAPGVAGFIAAFLHKQIIGD